MGKILPAAEFHSAMLPRQTRYDAWHSLVSAVFEPSPPAGQARADLRAEASSVHFGNALVVHATAEAQHFTRSRRLIATEGLDHYMIQVYRSGVCEGVYGDEMNIVRPGDIKIIDLGQPFHTLNTDFDNTTLTLPRAMLAPLLDRPDAQHGRVLPADTAMAKIIASHISALSTAGDGLGPDDGAAVAAATVRLVAACLGANPRAQPETRAYRSAAINQTMREFIDKHVQSPLLSAEFLAERFHMSRTQVYRLFVRDGGVAAHIQARRLHACLRALSDPARLREGVGEIAFAHGFASEAHFSRLFRRVFGVTPSDARAGADVPRPSGGATFISDWMRGLRGGAEPRVH